MHICQCISNHRDFQLVRCFPERCPLRGTRDYRNLNSGKPLPHMANCSLDIKSRHSAIQGVDEELKETSLSIRREYLLSERNSGTGKEIAHKSRLDIGADPQATRVVINNSV